jgi:hypothetical protein
MQAVRHEPEYELPSLNSADTLNCILASSTSHCIHAMGEYRPNHRAKLFPTSSIPHIFHCTYSFPFSKCPYLRSVFPRLIGWAVTSSRRLLANLPIILLHFQSRCAPLPAEMVRSASANFITILPQCLPKICSVPFLLGHAHLQSPQRTESIIRQHFTVPSLLRMPCPLRSHFLLSATYPPNRSMRNRILQAKF